MSSIAASTFRPRTERADLTTTVALAIAQAVVVAIVLAIGAIPQGGVPLTTYLVAVISGILTAAAYRIPVTALIVGVGMVIVYYVLDFPPIGVAVPILGTVYLASRAGHLVAASATAATLVTLSAIFRTIEGGESSAVLAYDTVTNLALVAATVALAALQRARDAAARQQQHLMDLERGSTQRRMDTERVRLARELHDSLGHRLAIVAVYAGVAREAGDDGRRIEALAQVQVSTRAALNELRDAVRMIRGGFEEFPLERIDDTVEAAASALRIAGLSVETTISDQADTVPAAVRGVAGRIVQEAVTNILKHARADRATIRVSDADGSLIVRVSDDGVAKSFERGNGIRSMEERVLEIGGSLSVAKAADGFVVEAILPWKNAS